MYPYCREFMASLSTLRSLKVTFLRPILGCHTFITLSRVPPSYFTTSFRTLSQPLQCFMLSFAVATFSTSFLSHLGLSFSSFCHTVYSFIQLPIIHTPYERHPQASYSTHNLSLAHKGFTFVTSFGSLSWFEAPDEGGGAEFMAPAGARLG